MLEGLKYLCQVLSVGIKIGFTRLWIAPLGVEQPAAAPTAAIEIDLISTSSSDERPRGPGERANQSDCYLLERKLKCEIVASASISKY